MKPTPRAAGVALALLLCAGAAPAQEDARVLPRGYLALKVGGEFTHFDSRRGGEGDGSLGAPFDTRFPASLFPTLATARDSLARFFTATAQPGENFALTPDDLYPGALDVDLAADQRRVPISLEAGVARRLTLRATLPVIRRETELLSLRLAGGAIGLNQNADTLAKLLGKINASLANIGRQTYLPLADSRAGREMQARYRRATNDTTTLPLPTGGPGRTRLNELLQAAQLGTLPIGSASESYRLGDLELAAKLQLLGGVSGALSPRETGARVAVEAGVRIPTAMDPGPDSLTDVVTDDGHAGASAALFADLPLGSRLWVGTRVRWAMLLPRDVQRHGWDPQAPWEGVGDVSTFSRKPGSRLEAAVAPHYQVTDQLAVSARYGFGRVGETTYESSGDDPSSVPFFPAGLESTAAATLHTVGAGLGYSTMGAFTARRTDIPLEIWLAYDTAVAGDGGAPDVGVVTLTGRIFLPAWGGR